MDHIFDRHRFTQSKLLFPGWGGVGWAGPGRVIVPSIRYNANYNIHLNSELPMGTNISPPNLPITYLKDVNETIQVYLFPATLYLRFLLLNLVWLLT